MAFVFFLIGCIATKIKHRVSTLVIEIINLSLFYIVIPIIIFDSIYNTENLGALTLAILASIIHIVLILAVAFGFTLIRGITDKSKVIAFSLSLAMPNAGYLAIPLSITLYNESASVIPYTIAFNIALPIAIVMLSLYSNTSSNRSEKTKLVIARSIPFLVAFTLAFSLRYANMYLPKPLYSIFNGIKWYTLTSFTLLGYEFTKTLQNSITKRLIYEILVSMVVRYAVSPLLIIVLISVLRIFEYSRGLMLQSIMPPAVANIILAKIFKLDTDTVSTLIVVLTPISIALSFILKFLNIIT